MNEKKIQSIKKRFDDMEMYLSLLNPKEDMVQKVLIKMINDSAKSIVKICGCNDKKKT